MKRFTVLFSVLLVVVWSGIASSNSAPLASSGTAAQQGGAVPELLSPAEGAELDNGREDRQDDIVWDFDWADVSGATEYHLYVKHEGSTYPVIDSEVLTGSYYHHVSSGSYIVNANRFDWRWKVRAKVGGQWGEWSAMRSFNVEPVNTDPPNQIAPLLSGNVYDKTTGLLISGAEVTIPNYPSQQTNESGQFNFPDIEPGQRTISVNKSGYYPVTQQVMVSQGSTFVSISMTPQSGGPTGNPVVQEIRAKYFSPSRHVYYLNGPSVTETITATIDWKGKTPKQVKWILPDGTTKTDTVSGNSPTRTFDMGRIGLGKVSVVAIAADSATSAPKQANCQVIPPPPGIPMWALRDCKEIKCINGASGKWCSSTRYGRHQV